MTDQPPPEASDAFRLGAEVDQPLPVSAEQGHQIAHNWLHGGYGMPIDWEAKLAHAYLSLEAELQAAQERVQELEDEIEYHWKPVSG